MTNSTELKTTPEELAFLGKSTTIMKPGCDPLMEIDIDFCMRLENDALVAHKLEAILKEISALKERPKSEIGSSGFNCALDEIKTIIKKGLGE